MCRGTICCDFIQLCTSYGHRRISNSVRLVLVLLKQRDGGDLSKEMAAIDVAVPDQAGSVRIEPDYVHIRSEEHTSELQSLMRISYAVFRLKKKKKKK